MLRLQPILSSPQNGELISSTGPANVVITQIEDGNSAQSLRLDVCSFVSGRIWIFVRKPNSMLLVFIRNAERIRPKATCWVTNLAQRLVGSLQVGIARIGQFGAHFSPAVETVDTRVRARDGRSVRRDWGDTGDAGFLHQLPATAIGWDADDDLAGRGSLFQPDMREGRLILEI